MSSVLFYATGNWIIQKWNHKELQSGVLKNRTVAIVSVLSLSVMLYFLSVYNGYVTIGSNQLGESTWLFYLDGYIGIAATLILCIILADVKPKTNGCAHIMEYIKWFGQNSFYVMATHFPIKEVLSRIVDKLFNCNVRTDEKYGLIVFVMTLIADTFVVWLICLIKKKWYEQRSNT